MNPLALLGRNAGLDRARARRIGSELAWVALGQGAAAVAALVGVRLLTSLLSPADYGEFALALTATNLIGQLLLGPIGQAAGRYYAAAVEKGQFSEYAQGLGWILVRGIAVVGFFAAILAVILVWSGNAALALLSFLAVLFASGQGLAGIFDAIQNAARHRWIVALHVGMSAWLRMIAAVVLLAAVRASSLLAMTGYAAGAAATLVSEAWFFHRKIRGRVVPSTDDGTSRLWWKTRILDYSWPFASWGILTFLHQSSDRWALGLSRGVAQAGVYSVLYQLSVAPMFMASTVAIQVVEPILYGIAGDASERDRVASAYRLMQRLVAVFLIGTALAVALAALLRQVVFDLLVARSYHGAIELMPVMVAAGGLFMAGQVATLGLTITGRSSPLVAPKVGTAVLGILLNIGGAMAYGVAGVAVAQVVFSASYLVWVLVLTRKHAR